MKILNYQGKNECFFDHAYWLKATNSLNKKLTCFKVGFLCFLGRLKFFNYLKKGFIKRVSYKLYYVKWIVFNIILMHY